MHGFRQQLDPSWTQVFRMVIETDTPTNFVGRVGLSACFLYLRTSWNAEMRTCVVVLSAKLIRRLPAHELGLPINGSKIFAVLPNRWLIACIFCQGKLLVWLIYNPSVNRTFNNVTSTTYAERLAA